MGLRVDLQHSQSRGETERSYRSVDLDCGCGELVRDDPLGHAQARSHAEAGVTGELATAAIEFPDPFDYLITDRALVRQHLQPARHPDVRRLDRTWSKLLRRPLT